MANTQPNGPAPLSLDGNWRGLVDVSLVGRLQGWECIEGV